MDSQGGEQKKSIYYWPERKRLVFLHKEASPAFWDQHWENEDWVKIITRSRKSRYWRGLLNKYLPDKNSRILEGGCGDGRFVDAMKFWGYEAIGVDFAVRTVDKINKAKPDLDVRYGDVRKLDFEDEYFDGYWSLGVIEHFWEGYQPIFSEMNRVLKPGGYVFISFPAISIMDKIQILTGRYKVFCDNKKPPSFYQFGLNTESVKNDFSQMGFEYITSQRRHGLLGIEHFLPSFKKINQKLSSLSEKAKIIKVLYFATSMLLAPLSNHSVLMIFRKPHSP